VDVRVRLDDASRGRSDLIDLLWVVPPAGPATPLSEIADITLGTSSSVIRRIDRARTISVTGDVEDGMSPETVVRDAAPKVKEILARHPGVTSSAGGRQRDLNDAFAALPLAILVAFGLIYVILAWLFGNYLQPFAIMMSIPFGIVGAIWGHFLLGYDLTFLSVIGLVALAGVVVNNAIVLVEFVNVERQAGTELRIALVRAGQRRIRPILLTSVTTILGLAPLVLEQSFQARFLAPMAISLCAGLASATALTLLLLPSMLYIIDDGVRLLRRIFHGPSARTLPAS
jgi:multidrug efflux pump subunit AcrB